MGIPARTKWYKITFDLAPATTYNDDAEFSSVELLVRSSPVQRYSSDLLNFYS